jgi:sugar lactone lactonase YvrE
VTKFRNFSINRLFTVVILAFAIAVSGSAQIPPPLITSITPPSAASGSPAASIQIGGQNFVPGSTISWTTPNGFQTSIAPTLVQAAQIAATVPAAFLTTAGTAQLAITGPSGTQSNTAAFTITAPNWITSVSPASTIAGAPVALLTLVGPFFSGTPTVTWTSPDGQSTVLAPDQVQSGQITVTIPGSLLRLPGFAHVGITGSNQLTVAVKTGTGLVSPSSVPYGGAALPVTITGTTLFGPGSVVQWTRPDGKTASIIPALVQGAQIAATIPSAFLTTPGTAQIAVADPSGIISTPPLPFTITSALSITSVSPNLQLAGAGAMPITVTAGSALAPGTTVRWTDSKGVVTNLGGLIGAAQIAATVSSSLLSSAGTALVGLVDGAAVLSNQLPFQVQPFAISSVLPGSTPAGSTSTPVTISGANLGGAASVVLTAPGGQTFQFPLDFFEAAQVTATLPAASLTTAGTAQVALADVFGNTSNTISFSIAPVLPLTILTSSIQTSVAGQFFTTAFTATGGNPLRNYAWSLASTGAPPFMSLSSTGQFTLSAASVPGSYPLVVQVEDLSGNIASAALTVNIETPLSINDASALPTGVVGIPYSKVLSASGGVPANYIWSATGLPASLTLAPNGTLSGSLTAGGAVIFTAQVTDGAQTATRTFTLPVNAQLTIVAPPLPAAWVNRSYPAATLTAPGGTQPYTWSISAGALPRGMALDPATGILSGTPATAGVANLTAQVVDSTGASGKTATLALSLVVARQYVISTVAGGVPPAVQPAIGAPLDSIQGIATDASGNTYFTNLNSVFKTDASGTLTLIAGNGKPGYSGDGGLAVNAQLNSPQGIALDGVGNLYVADIFNSRIRRISPTGTITTVAGTGGFGSSGDGASAQLATLGSPSGIAIDRGGNVYVSDSFQNSIRKISPSGVIGTIAALPFQPGGLAVDIAGNVFVTDSSHNAIKEISVSGAITTIAGTGVAGYSGDGGPANTAQLNNPAGIAVDAAGNLYIADFFNSAIRKISAGVITTLTTAALAPFNLAVDRTGSVYYSVPYSGFNAAGGQRTTGPTLFRRTQTADTTVIAGSSSVSSPIGDGGPAAAATFNGVSDVVIDRLGNIYAAEILGARVRRISTDGTISTFAGNGNLGSLGDGGPAIAAAIEPVYGTALDRAGNLYLATADNRIRKVNGAGIISTVAGGGTQVGDGVPALNAVINSPRGLAVDAAGNLFIADSDNNRVRKVDSSGVINTIAGNGAAGYSGDGGQAVQSTLNLPMGLTFDNAGNLYIADSGNFVVRKVTSNGVITRVAGSGIPGQAGDGGLATNAQLIPNNLLVDHTGNLIIQDGLSLREVSPDGIISTIAGNFNNALTYSGVVNNGDGGAAFLTADFYNSVGLAEDSLGDIYVGDFAKLRRLTPESADRLLLPISPFNGLVNAPYTWTAVLTGGTPPYTASVSGLPPGLTLDPASGAISGIPTAQGIFDFTYTLTDSGTIAATGAPAQVFGQNFRIAITGPPFVNTTSLPAGIVNQAYPATAVVVGGGTAGYTWAITQGALPAGLALDTATGIVSGTPIAAGSFPITVTITDSSSPALTATQRFTLVVDAPLVIQTTSLRAVAGTPYATTFTATGGNPLGNYTWSIVSTGAPAFVSLSPTGQFALSAASTPGSYPLVIQVQDLSGNIASAPVTVNVAPALSINDASTLPTGVVGIPYSKGLSASGGVPANYIWSATGLPASLTLAPNGTLSGTLISGGPVIFTAQVTNGAQTATRTFTLPVNAQLTIVAPPLAAAWVNRSYPAATLTAPGGTQPYTWSISAGALPSGMALDPATGILSGTPAMPGVANFTAKVVDSTGASGKTATLALSLVVARQYVISTVAGGVPPSGQPAVGAPISFNNVGIATDTTGNTYITGRNSVFKADTNGTLTLIAGNGKPGYSGDGGPAVNAQLNSPNGIALDRAGNLYVADFYNRRIRRISSTGVITTVAGTGAFSSPGDGGSALLATLGSPSGVAVDQGGNIYFADEFRNSVRKISASGVISTIATQLFGPNGVAVDDAGNVFVADSLNNAIKEISVSGAMTTVAGTGTAGYSGDGGPAITAQLNNPVGVAVDAAGNLYVADTFNSVIRKISAGVITTLTTLSDNPRSVAVDRTGSVYYSGIDTQRVGLAIFRRTQGGDTSLIAGNISASSPIGDGGQAAGATFNGLIDVAIDRLGNIYTAEFLGARVRRIVPDGTISTFAGNGNRGFSGDGGPATAAAIEGLWGIALDRAGNLYLADVGNRIRKVNTAGIISTVAGNGTQGYSGDGGPAVHAAINTPRGLAVDAAGNLFIADTGNNRVRKVDASGVITTVAGNGASGYSGDGAQAGQAALNAPVGLTFDDAGNLYIADFDNFVVRKVASNGVITTMAGSGTPGDAGDGGLATNAQLDPVNRLLADKAGNLIIEVQGDIREVSPDGIIDTIAGNFSNAFNYNGVVNNGDGGSAFLLADFYSPGGLAEDSLGNIYVADFAEVRRLTPESAGRLFFGIPGLPISPSNGVINTPYTWTAVFTGGTPPYTSSVSGLPPGLTLDPTSGGISGTPTLQGIFDFTYTVTDSGTIRSTGAPAQVFARNFRIAITGAPFVVTTSLPTGIVNQAYPATAVVVGGGTAGYTWAITQGALPAGLALDTATGIISGTPTVTGSFPITLTVTDSSIPRTFTDLSGTFPLTTTRNFTLVILGPANVGGGSGGSGAPPISSGSSVSAAPATLTFKASPATVTGSAALTISNTAASAGFNASVTTTTGGNWLSVSPASGTVGTTAGKQTLNVMYNAAGLGQGTYLGSVNITSDTSTASVAVTLQVSGQITVSPSSLNFTYRLGDPSAPAAQTISVFSTPAGIAYSLSYTGGAWLAPPSSTGTSAPGAIGISIVPSFVVAGTFKGQVTITPVIGAPVIVPVTLTVQPAAPAQLSVSPPLSTYPLTQRSSAASGQVTVSNTGGGTLQFTAEAASDTGSWLKLNGAGSGSATSSAAAVVAYSVDPSGLQPGIYAGRITITDAIGNQSVAGVALVLGQPGPSIQLSRSGITVNAVAGANVQSTQSFAVLNAGGGTMNWTAEASTVTGGKWLGVSPAAGASLGGQAGTGATVSIDSAGLAQGQYYGTVAVSSPDAVNTPESISVLLNVAADGSGAAVSLSTGAVILAGAAGSTQPRTGQVTIFNPGTASLHFSATPFTSSGETWLSVSPVAGSLSPGSSALTIQADLSKLAAGVHTGTVGLIFDDGTVNSITAIEIATGGTASVTGSAIATSALRPRAANACALGSAAYLVSAFAEPLSQAPVQPAVAQLVRVLLVDDCGKPVAAGGAAQVSFSNPAGKNDAPINLQDAGGGVWEGTWIPVNAGTSIALNVRATGSAAAGALQSSSATTTVSVMAAGSNVVAAQPLGIVNAAGAAQTLAGVVTPGAIVSIYGNGLVSGPAEQALSIPLPVTLANTQVLLGNQPLPLFYASTGQINGLVPQGLNPNASYQLVIARGNTRSVPVPVSLAQYEPAIFTMNFSGAGQGAIQIAGTAVLAGPNADGSRPARGGAEFLSIFCTGLGPVVGPNGEPPPADGAAAPSNLLYTTTAKVTATIGAVDVPVVFAGLTPGAVALYQVNVQLPAGVTTGDAVPLVLTVTDSATGGRYVSNSVTVAIQ